MSQLKVQYAEMLADIGFLHLNLRAYRQRSKRRGDGVLELTGELLNENSNNIKVIIGVLCAGLYSNVVQVSTML
jgi:ATP-dependent RNA helicase DHX57